MNKFILILFLVIKRTLLQYISALANISAIVRVSNLLCVYIALLHQNPHIKWRQSIWFLCKNNFDKYPPLAI